MSERAGQCHSMARKPANTIPVITPGFGGFPHENGTNVRFVMKVLTGRPGRAQNVTILPEMHELRPESGQKKNISHRRPCRSDTLRGETLRPHSRHPRNLMQVFRAGTSTIIRILRPEHSSSTQRDLMKPAEITQGDSLHKRFRKPGPALFPK